MKKAILWGVVALTLFAFVGCGGDDPDDPPPPDVLKLTVTGIPGEVSIMAGSLLTDMTGMGSAVAGGANIGGTISFYELEITDQGPMPGDKFTTLGEYYIVLATSMDGSGTNYLYAEPVPQMPTMKAPAKYTFTKLEGNTLAWTDFIDPTTLGQ